MKMRYHQRRNQTRSMNAAEESGSTSAPLPPPSRPGWGIHIMYLASVVSLVSMVVQMVRVWWYPEWGYPEQAVRHAVTIMFAEFFLVHAGFLALALSVLEEKKHRIIVLALILSYSVGCGSLVLSMARGASSMFVLTYAAVILTRSLSAYMTRNERGPGINAVVRSAAAVLFYLIAVFATISIPFPAGAIGQMRATGRGWWDRHPEQVLGVATIFFLGLACVEIFLWCRSSRVKNVPVKAVDPMAPLPLLGVLSLLLFFGSLLALWFLTFPDFFFVLLISAAILSGVCSRSNAGAVSVILSVVSFLLRGYKVLYFGF